jgi:hypothetical protein
VGLEEFATQLADAAPAEPTAAAPEVDVSDQAVETTPDAAATEPGDAAAEPAASEPATSPGDAEPAAPEPTETDAAGDEPEENRDFIDWFDDTYKHKTGEKFKKDEDFFSSVDQMIRMQGRRDENAELGKRLQERLTPEQIQTLLAGGQFETGQPAKKPDADGTPSNANGPPDWNPAWITRNEKGELVPAFGAPADVQQRYAAHQQWMQQRIEQMASNPKEFFKDVLADQQAEVEKVKVAAAQRQEQLELQAWEHQHKAMLYVGGDSESGLTADGQKVADLVEKWGPEGDNWVPDFRARLELATEMVRAGRTTPNPPKPPARKAMRQPGVASPPGDDRTIEQRIEAGEGLADVYESLTG